MKGAVPGFISMLAAVAALLCAVSDATAAAKYRVVYRFAGGSDGSAPVSRLTADSSGNLYGTTQFGGNLGCQGFGDGCGTIFELKRPASRGGTWTEIVLYRFTGGGDGEFPVTELTRDVAGNLYGTTSGDFIDCEDQIQCGTVYELVAPAGGRSAWTLTTLHTFSTFVDGGCPRGALLAGSGGELIGTTCYGGPFGYGTVFELSPPGKRGAAWTLTVLFGFPADSQGDEPYANVAFDTAGNAYGTTSAGGLYEQGVAYKLTRTRQLTFRETVLVLFDGTNGRWPLSQPIFDSHGNMYATTLTGGSGGCASGTVFELTPPRWQQTFVHVFCAGNDGWAPTGQLVMDATGRIYGTTTNGGSGQLGTTYALAPPPRKGGAWTETILHVFAGGRDGLEPSAGVTMSNGALYGPTIGGGTGGCQLHGQRVDCGIIYEVAP
jgi:uncharacterized repeat protein (TIGR03803 family)